MKSTMPLILSSVFVAIVILAWTLIIALNVGFENVFTILTGDAKARIESFGQLGASYGFLASIFAGLAVVLLWQNIHVQQRELTELKEQMEEDRSLSVLVWMLNHYKELRKELRHTQAYGDGSGRYFEGADVVEGLFSRLKESRAGGDYGGESTGAVLMSILKVSHGGRITEHVRALDPIVDAAADVARFLSSDTETVNHRLLRLVWTILTSRDLFVIHEICLLRDDDVLLRLFADCSFFGGIEAELIDEIRNGPSMPAVAYAPPGSRA